MTHSHERQSARMSKITNDGLTRSGTGCLLYLYGNSGRQRVNEIAVVKKNSKKIRDTITVINSRCR